MRVIILAAGHGKRMQHELPKPLVPLCGKPMVQYLLDSIQKSGVCDDPVIVVSPESKPIFEQTIGKNHFYVLQEEQLGTGHAVMAAQKMMEGVNEPIMVLYGDTPWVSAETLRKVAQTSEDTQSVLTMATAVLPDFEGWHSAFSAFGRIVRDEKGEVASIVERKDATSEEALIKEVNPAYMCFQPEWLWENLKSLKNNNVQHEYYLTDLVKIAFEQGKKIATVQIDPKEAVGINTKEHLEMCEEIAKGRT